MLLLEHSAILLTFIKLPFVIIKIFVLSIFAWSFYTDFTVYLPTIISQTFLALILPLTATNYPDFAASLTLCLLGNLSGFFCHPLFFKIFSSKSSFRNTIRVTVWIQIRPDILSGQIWVQTDCKKYQQTEKSPQVRKELTDYVPVWDFFFDLVIVS